ncbi:MAG: hypothetical protein ACRCVJ_05870 [Clostridium sp.]|uniref:hypothetical protein n=1 Tax=Clostridium sp. TaxID=1506 RepID=UPI003F35A723
MKVNLSDVIEAIEFEGELLSHYYNKETGIIIYVEDESTSKYKAEDFKNINNFEEWERELITGLNHLKEHPEEYIQLPNNDDINEDAMMMEFVKSLGDEFVSNIPEDKTIRKYIESIGKLGEWYDYRENAEYELAKAWCNEHNIQFAE